MSGKVGAQTAVMQKPYTLNPTMRRTFQKYQDLKRSGGLWPPPVSCALCSKPPLRHVLGRGFCGDHYSEAVKAQTRVLVRTGRLSRNIPLTLAKAKTEARPYRYGKKRYAR